MYLFLVISRVVFSIFVVNYLEIWKRSFNVGVPGDNHTLTCNFQICRIMLYRVHLTNGWNHTYNFNDDRY